MATATIYPSLDGWVGNNDNTADLWSVIRGASGSGWSVDESSEFATGLQIYGDLSGGSNNYNYFKRSIFVFDTSSIGLAHITSATLKIKVHTGASPSDTDSSSLSLVSASPASDSSLAATDYEITKFGSTKLAADIAISSLSAGSFFTFTLNSSGLAHINTVGKTRFGVRIDHDVDNNEPASSSVRIDVSTDFVDNATQANRPYLTVNYQPTAGAPLMASLAF